MGKAWPLSQQCIQYAAFSGAFSVLHYKFLFSPLIRQINVCWKLTNKLFIESISNPSELVAWLSFLLLGFTVSVSVLNVFLMYGCFR